MKALRLALATLLLLLLTSPVAAQTMPVPSPPSLGAPSYILLDFESGNVLVERESDTPREPASLVKLMTAYVAFHELREGHLSLDEKVMISETAWRMGGSKMFVEVGKQVQVEDLLRGIIIQSGNDASVAIAEHIAGNEQTFAQLMNNHAEEIGMYNTNFTNSTGWPDEAQTTTARDMALLAAAMIRNFPEFYQYYSEREFTYNDITQGNRNLLLTRDSSVDGLKTGHTSTAGYNLVSSAKRDDMRLVAVVMGTDGPRDRADQSQALFNYGFRFFRSYALYEGNTALTSPKLWKGAQDTIPVGLERTLYVTIPQREYDNLDANMRIDSPVMAPVQRGDKLGEITVSLDGQVLVEAPLIALEDGDEGGFFSGLIDEVLLLFQ